MFIEVYNTYYWVSYRHLEHDHWLNTNTTLVGINFSSLKEVTEVFL